MKEQIELNPKIEFVILSEGSRSRKVPLLQLNGSADILPDLVSMVGNCIKSLETEEVGEQCKLSKDALLEAACGGPVFPESGLVAALQDPDPEDEGLDAKRFTVFTGGSSCIFAVVNTSNIDVLPTPILCIVYDQPKKIERIS